MYAHIDDYYCGDQKQDQERHTIEKAVIAYLFHPYFTSVRNLNWLS